MGRRRRVRLGVESRDRQRTRRDRGLVYLTSSFSLLALLFCSEISRSSGFSLYGSAAFLLSVACEGIGRASLLGFRVSWKTISEP